MTSFPAPFGVAAVSAVPRTLTFSMRHVANPDVLCERLLSAGVRGAGLLARRTESGAVETLVAARNLLRLELRGSLVTIIALELVARPLLPLLAGRLADLGIPAAEVDGDTLHATVPNERAAPGTPDEEVLRAPSALCVLRAAAGLIGDSRPDAPLPPGLLGAFGYELVDRWEDLGPRNPDPLDEPDFTFVLVSDMVVFDGATGRVTAIVRGLPWERQGDVAARADGLAGMLRTRPHAIESSVMAVPGGATPDPYQPEFGDSVRTLLQHIAAGDIFQAVLSRAVALPSAASPLQVLRALGTDAPWRFLLDLGDGELVGASPETCLRVERGSVELRPLAGTVPRGFGAGGEIDGDLDRRLGVQLLLDQKEQAEHAMLVDLARNDVARVCVPGTTQLTEAFELLQLPRVQHLASRVCGRLRPGLDALHAYRAVANMGTLTGAPKPMAMALVRKLETTARGFYGGAIGFLGSDGDLRSCIAIRMLRRKRDTAVYHARAGAGIVYDSVPANEFAETEHKLSQLRAVLAGVLP